MPHIVLRDAHGHLFALGVSGDGTVDDPYALETASGGGGVDIGEIAAGENHIGKVSGLGAVITPAITVSTTPAYTAGDSIGGKITLANAVRVSGGISLLQSIMVLDRANQKPAGTILIYNADPSAATLTDNAALVNSTDDLKIIAQIPIYSVDYVTVNSKAYAMLRNLGAEVKAASGTTLYASFCTTSTPTFAATSDLQIAFGFLYAN